jgi:hypothetical protein
MVWSRSDVVSNDTNQVGFTAAFQVAINYVIVQKKAVVQQLHGNCNAHHVLCIRIRPFRVVARRLPEGAIHVQEKPRSHELSSEYARGGELPKLTQGIAVLGDAVKLLGEVGAKMLFDIDGGGVPGSVLR